MAKNPILPIDFPDPDVIRVGDTYYMASTTMFLMPGGDILKSKDLVHWELAAHVFETLGAMAALLAVALQLRVWLFPVM